MKNEKRTFNTLFMISSVDGKISTGVNDKRDIDKDFPKIKGIREGLKQYYELEKKTDLHSLNTGRVMEKIGINNKKQKIKKTPVSFIIIDNKPHLITTGVNNLLKKCKTLYLVTTNKKHLGFKIKEKNLVIIYYEKKIDFKDLFKILKTKYKVNQITIQSGGTMNSTLLRENLIDRLPLVLAPALIGGKNTSTLVDGESLISENDLKNIKSLKLKSAEKLRNSYLHLIYYINK